ncbi:hypothetical protein GQ651_05370 [Alphaproteobacteria bacterium GH1-50]|uniref:Uncharacterized protein n=1 Tax=Kangsaoukella pontilimi TaxID=2691042 RepID=A0A7C9MC28_9RHOB|nr:DUF6477 family protein [Kangsaoukella pontilimi]MXQ07271.1 hypothetical protein [Kangsaoukella pontilimi]
MPNRLAALRRPRLLVRAARHGTTDYDRARALPRLLDMPGQTTPEHALSALIAAEAEVEDRRKGALATYSVARHIELLAALMVEARLIAGRA